MQLFKDLRSTVFLKRLRATFIFAFSIFSFPILLSALNQIFSGKLDPASLVILDHEFTGWTARLLTLALIPLIVFGLSLSVTTFTWVGDRFRAKQKS